MLLRQRGRRYIYVYYVYTHVMSTENRLSMALRSTNVQTLASTGITNTWQQLLLLQANKDGVFHLHTKDINPEPC